VRRFITHRTIPATVPSNARMPVITCGYFLAEKRAMKSTIFCRVASGSSPGTIAATAIAATSTAESAPRYACQLFSMLFNMSMQADGVSKPHPALDQLPDHRADGPSTHTDKPDLSTQGMGGILHLAEAAVVFPQAGLRSLDHIQNYSLTSLDPGDRFAD